MHIPIGKFEGKEIQCTKDRCALTPRELTVKEEIFDIIGSRISRSNILDINDSNGLYGLEALSRGAYHVTFLGTDKESNQVIHENLEKVNAKSDEFQHNLITVEDYFEKLNKEEKFDIIFFEIGRQEEISFESKMVQHLTEEGLLILFVPIIGGFQVPVSVEGAVIQESRDSEQYVVLIVSKKR